MLFRYYLVYIFTLCSALSFAQSDTIFQFIEKSGSTEERIDRIINYGGRLIFNSPEKIPELIILSQDLSKTVNNKRLEASIYNLKGLYSRYQGDLDSSIYFHQQSLKILRELPDHIQLSREYNHLSITLHGMGRYDQYLAYNDSAIDQAKAVADSGYHNLLLNNRAFILLQLGDTAATISLLRKILPDMKDNPGLMSATLGNVARIFLMKGDHDSTFYYLNQALKYATLAKDQRAEAMILVQLGVLHFERKEYDLARVHWDKALVHYEELDDVAGQIRTKAGEARLLAVAGKTDEAIAMIDSLLKVGKRSNLHRIAMEIIEEKIRVHEISGNHEAALQAYKRLKFMEDSIGQEQMQQQIAELETKFQAREKEQELIALRKDQELQKAKNERLYIILLTVVLIMLMLIAFLRIRYRSRQKIAEKERARLSAEVARREIEEQKLRDEIKLKSKQLTGKALSLSERNEFLNRLLIQLQQAGEASEAERQVLLKTAEREIKINLRSKAEWKEFNTYFEEVNSGFTETLQANYPELSTRELRLLALAKLGLTTREISNLLHIAPDSVKMARYRLKKKLHLSEEESIESFLQQIHNSQPRSA